MKKLIFVSLMMILASCRKDPSSVSGSNSLVYESEEYIDMMTGFSPVVNTAALNVENAAPYQHILGNILEMATKSKIDGKGIAVSNVEIANVRVTAIELYSGYDIDELESHLDDAELSLKYLDASSNYIVTSLGTMSSVNIGQSKVLFNVSNADLTSFLKNNPDKLSFNLSFNGVPSSTLEAKYRVVFEYQYSYDEQKVK